MANYFRDFMQPAKIIFDRLNQQNNKRIVVNAGNGSRGGPSVTPPSYPELPEYPCKLIRDSSGKVCEIHYGQDARGPIWKQTIIRAANGNVDHILQENPDGSFKIVIHRDNNNKVDLVDLE